ncbi:hypothetical protein CCHL11_04705 [Colletotrichum chlorophyti]|uniref:SWIM-type domain-containing protein n=1 Tax=Colletotrichum chlorophyti TaxID=708187 RepID=A0A1Q8S1U4_9PEZI|nr:hypothetical protein CCHL11_04705 [Colletotrichum chlorophyti]
MSHEPPPAQSYLPTPRVLITSLINSLTSPVTATATPHEIEPSDTTPQKSLPQPRRPLLITLHVLFPSLVLPALDLLDRNLVTRVVPEPCATPDSNNKLDPPAFHLVRSVASTISRRSHATSTSTASASTTYLVQLGAWNCTCANFAFEAFPAGEVTELAILDANDAGGSGDDASTREWQFGGLSSGGLEHGGVPCCKHLLACILSEQWGDVLGNYVTERIMSREEMAGTVADV